MRSTNRRRVVAAFVAVTALAAGSAGRAWFWDTARAAAEADSLRQTLREEEERAVVLDAETRASQARIRAKLALVEELVVGRVTLARAADEFRKLNAVYPTFFANMRLLYPGLPDAELLCRNVIDYCAAALEHRPERTAVLAHLEDEFAAFRRSESR